MVNKGKTFILKLAIFIFTCMFLTIADIPLSESGGKSVETVYAATNNISIVCGKKKQVKAPSSWKKVSYSSSNKKVATVTKTGTIKAVRLGTTKITVKSGNKKKTYTVTVVPQNKTDIYLDQQAVSCNQTHQFKIVSNKYDTSQIKAEFKEIVDEDEEYFLSVSKSGYYDGTTDNVADSGEDNIFHLKSDAVRRYQIEYKYGTYKQTEYISVYSPSYVFDCLIYITCDSRDDNLNKVYHCTDVFNGIVYSPLITVGDNLDEVMFGPSYYKNLGIQIYDNGKLMTDNYAFQTPGVHNITISSGDDEFTCQLGVSLKFNEALKQKNVEGFTAFEKKILEKTFSITNSIITPGMTEEEKVKAIHDYIVNNTVYTNRDTYETEYPGYGQTIHGFMEGRSVCAGYAGMFNILAYEAGLDVRTISYSDVDDHAWNLVKVDGIWYQIDCTWDDSITNDLQICYTYFLSQSGWSDDAHNVDLSGFDWENECYDEGYIQIFDLVYLSESEDQYIRAWMWF